MNILFFLKPKNDIIFVHDDSLMTEVLEIIKNYRHSAIPVLDEEGKYVGTITEGDVLDFFINYSRQHYEKSFLTPLRRVPRRRDYACVRVNADIEDLILKATTQNFVPVIDDSNSFIGIVTRGDIISYMYNKAKRENNF